MKAEIKAMYFEGFNPFEIAEKFGISVGKVRAQIGRHLRPRDRIDEQEVISLHRKGKSEDKIAKILGFSRGAINRALKKHGMNRSYLRNHVNISMEIRRLQGLKMSPEEIARILQIDLVVVQGLIK